VKVAHPWSYLCLWAKPISLLEVHFTSLSILQSNTLWWPY